MKLYYSPGTCSLASHIVAEEEGLSLEYERVDLKTHKTEYGENFFDINPKGYVPALKLDSGELLTENVVILPYLADREPTARLAPPHGTIERLRLIEWLSYLSSELHKVFTPFFSDDDNLHKASSRGTLEKRFEFLAGEMANRSYLLGEHFSVADAYLFVLLRWTRLASMDLTSTPTLAEYRDRILARDGVKRAMSAEGLRT